MSLHTFSIEAVQKVGQHIRAQLVLPPSEQQPTLEGENVTPDELPEPASLDALGDLFRLGGFGDEDLSAPNRQGRWFISTIDPAVALNKLPGLNLKSDVRLVTYLQQRSDGGVGVTWALPKLMSTTVHLEAALESVGEGAPPRPRGALSNVMEAIEGNDTPASFVAASLLARELKELGRTGKLRRWSHHRLIGKVPSQRPWQWRSKVPQDLSPKVKRSDQGVLVEFFSCRVVPPIALFRHVDQYPAGSYRPKTNDQVIAQPEPAKRS